MEDDLNVIMDPPALLTAKASLMFNLNQTLNKKAPTMFAAIIGSISSPRTSELIAHG